MPQIFGPRANTISRVSILGTAAFLGGALLLWAWFIHNAAYLTGVGIVPDQPVPFNHEVHVRDLSLDCRYCHATVDKTAFAGMPTSATCMTCHSQVWKDVASMAIVESSFESQEPLAWTRVHDLPDHAYFDHSAHVNQGVACETCHGRVDQMGLVYKTESLSMSWCLDCHRNPQQYVRPPDAVYTMGWQRPLEDTRSGETLVMEQNIDIERLDDCYVCHR
ncbi:MAG: cytochrome C [Anaerolineaceae bacterium]|nr:cytochrome C [Anaerolineaceae bacterium]